MTKLALLPIAALALALPAASSFAQSGAAYMVVESGRQFSRSTNTNGKMRDPACKIRRSVYGINGPLVLGYSIDTTSLFRIAK